MSFDNIIFEDKTLSDMFSDVYKNTGSKRSQINEFIAKLVRLIQTPEDAAVLGPVISHFFDTSVKNDEHIVRLVQIAQRMVSATTKGGENDLLTDAEKEQLFKNVKIEFEAVLKEQDEIQDTIDGLTK